MSAPKSVPGRPLSYRDAGVDIDAGDRAGRAIKPFAKRTLRPEVLAGIGGFGALIELPKRYREPVLVAGTDGVGTKLKLAFALNRHDTIGIDLVAMSVNDILVQGAEPLFFPRLLRLRQRSTSPSPAKSSSGIAQGCELAGCALIGGETAEHAEGMYVPGEYDLAGFAVGVVEKVARDRRPQHRCRRRTARARVQRTAFERLFADPRHPRARARRPRANDRRRHRRAHARRRRCSSRRASTSSRCWHCCAECEVKGMAHITGGGLSENTHRMFPDELAARIDAAPWPRPPIFDWLQRQGNVAAAEMYRVFNCGIGFVLVVAPEAAAAAIARLSASGETVHAIGTVVRAPRPMRRATVVA